MLIRTTATFDFIDQSSYRFFPRTQEPNVIRISPITASLIARIFDVISADVWGENNRKFFIRTEITANDVTNEYMVLKTQWNM